MKKATLLVALAVFFLALSGISFAEKSGETEEGSKKYHGMMKKGGMKGMQCMMMMKKMMQKEIVATGDGGVIVLDGNNLMKYDKDLNLVKEAEIKMDMEGMMKNMKDCMNKMKEDCQEMGKDTE